MQRKEARRASWSYNKTVAYTKHHSAPSPAEIARMKAAHAAGITIKDMRKRFNYSVVTIRKLLGLRKP
jgi:hypothetical protein